MVSLARLSRLASKSLSSPAAMLTHAPMNFTNGSRSSAHRLLYTIIIASAQKKTASSRV